MQSDSGDNAYKAALRRSAEQRGAGDFAGEYGGINSTAGAVVHSGSGAHSGDVCAERMPCCCVLFVFDADMRLCGCANKKT